MKDQKLIFILNSVNFIFLIILFIWGIKFIQEFKFDNSNINIHKNFLLIISFLFFIVFIIKNILILKSDNLFKKLIIPFKLYIIYLITSFLLNINNTIKNYDNPEERMLEIKNHFNSITSLIYTLFFAFILYVIFFTIYYLRKNASHNKRYLKKYVK